MVRHGWGRSVWLTGQSTLRTAACNDSIAVVADGWMQPVAQTCACFFPVCCFTRHFGKIAFVALVLAAGGVCVNRASRPSALCHQTIVAQLQPQPSVDVTRAPRPAATPSTCTTA